MWVPTDSAQIEQAAKAGDLRETPSFDAKSDLPKPSRNADLAVDAAMATDGGVLLYGVAEDQHGEPTVPQPIELAGAGERIGQIVATSISEVPYIDVRAYTTETDPSKGYLAVIVPQSARAPHQVTVGGNLRYYGRGAKGHRVLTEAVIARLYRRREDWEQDRSELLATVVAHAGIPEADGAAYLHAFTRPVASDQELFERAVERLGGPHQVHQWMIGEATTSKLQGGYSPALGQSPYWDRRGADEWRLATRSEDERGGDVTGLVELRVNIDGRGQLFCGRAADFRLAGGPPIIIEAVIAGNLAAFFAVMGSIYEAAGYHGRVDAGVAITGIEGEQAPWCARRTPSCPISDTAHRRSRARRGSRLLSYARPTRWRIGSYGTSWKLRRASPATTPSRRRADGCPMWWSRFRLRYGSRSSARLVASTACHLTRSGDWRLCPGGSGEQTDVDRPIH